MIKNPYLNKLLIGIAAFFLVISMTSCNSINSVIPPNNKPASDGNNANEKEQAAKNDNSAPDPGDNTVYPVNFHVPPNQILKTGDEIQGSDVQNDGIVPNALTYVIKKATLFDNIEASGIKPEDISFSNQVMVDENGKLKSSIKFILIELSVKNICALPARNITSFNFYVADSVKTLSDSSLDIAFLQHPEVFNLVYFSNPTGTRINGDWQGYFNYQLSVGQSKDLKIGWYVDTEKCDPLKSYIVFNEGDNEYQKVIKLDF